jgi:uncharacterized membrane protein|tara:strand:+ start:13497 stop:13748 length:252 start_codon:yes stop_codon:yes gene_type:complete
MEKHEHKHREEKSHKLNRRLWIMAIVLGLIIVISGVQAIQLVSLRNQLDNEITTLSTSKSTVSTGSDTLSKNLQNLPSMVGGC